MKIKCKKRGKIPRFYVVSFVACFLKNVAKTFSSAMRTFENTLIVNMKRKGGFPPLGVERFAAFGADVFVLCNMLSRNYPNNYGKDNHRNGNYPPFNVKLSVKPINLACDQRACRRVYQTK